MDVSKLLVELGEIIPYLGQTHGHCNLFLPNLRVYFIMKTLLAKALMSPLVGFPIYIEEFYAMHREI